MPNAAKDTLYIDAEDEITAVIDKVVHAKHKIVAVVLPKHASTFQSIVNMKLLKKATGAAKKNLVLITSDKAVINIASNLQIHVAKSLSTKPEIPEMVTTNVGATELTESASASASTTADAPEAKKASSGADTDDETIELDNSVDIEDDGSNTEKASPGKKKTARIPDFSRFSIRLALGMFALISLFVLWLFGFVILPKATVTVTTDTMTTSVNEPASFRAGEAELDLEENIFPAERVQTEKRNEATVSATGEKNVGEEATGVLTLTNCIDDGENKVIPAGTRFSNGSLTFLTAEQVILPAALTQGGNCVSDEFGLSRNVDAIAAEPGDQYNIPEGSYNSSISGIRAYGSDMSGGTTEIVTVIAEEDVEQATSQLAGSSTNEARQELGDQLRELGFRAVDETLREGEPEIDVTPAVGEEASEVTVVSTLSYSLLGISQQDLLTFLEAKIQESLSEEDQKNIRDTGIDGVDFQFIDRPSDADTRLTIETIAELGPELDTEALKEEFAGQKRGDIEKRLLAIDGVRNVEVTYSPMWITTTPKSAEKIDIIFIEENDDQTE